MLELIENNEEEEEEEDRSFNRESNNQPLNGEEQSWQEQIPRDLAVDSEWDDIYPSNYSSSNFVILLSLSGLHAFSAAINFFIMARIAVEEHSPPPTVET